MHHINTLRVLAMSTFLEGVRHKALWAIVIMAVVLSMVNIFIVELFAWDLGKICIEFGLSTVAFTGLLIIFFLGLKILNDDLERNRISLIMSRPVQSWQYILGKFFGLTLILLVAILILGAGTTASMHYVLANYPSFVPPDFSWNTYLLALCSQWLALLMMLAVSFLCFSFASQPFVALVLSIAVYFAGQNMELLRRVVVENAYAGILSGQEKAVIALSWLLPNLSLFDKKLVAAYGAAFSLQEFFLLVSYSFTYSGLLLFVSVFFFNRRELS